MQRWILPFLVLGFAACSPAPVSTAATPHPNSSASTPLEDPGTQPVRFERKDGRYFASVDRTRTVRIMQLTDVHFDGDEERTKKTKSLISAELSRFKPDLVVITGDLAWTLFNPSGLSAYVQDAAKFMNETCLANDTYWAFSWGNHDIYYTDGDAAKDKLGAALAKYRIDQPNGRLLFEYETEPAGQRWGRFTVELTDRSTGRPLWINYSLFSGAGFKTTTSIEADGRRWLAMEADAARHRNGDKPVPAFAFFHIPLEQYRKGWLGNESHGWIMDGFSTQPESDTVIDSFAKAEVVACFAGHDHLNHARTQWLIGSRFMFLYYGRYSGYGAPDGSGDPIKNPAFPPGCSFVDLDLSKLSWSCWYWYDGLSEPKSIDAERKWQ